MYSHHFILLAETSFTADPVWPWSLSAIGMPALVTVALILTILTIWTYRGVPGVGFRRMLVVLGLRLAALIVAVLTLVRPSLASRDETDQPSVLLFGLDASKSMTNQDAYNNQSRYTAMKHILERCRPLLEELEEEHNITVRLHQFAADVEDFDPEGEANGTRSDYGLMLRDLFELYGSERHLRGLVVVGDGADNGTRYVASTEAEKWRGRACPINTFVLGLTTTSSKQSDVILTSVVPEPSPVPVKGKLRVKVRTDAPGYEGQPLRYRLLIDGKESGPVRQEVIRRANDNTVTLETSAPDTAGEIKVTVKVDPLPGEVTPINNEITTFVTVAKEGLSVLYIGGRIRWEQTFIRRALAQDPRIRLYEINRLSDQLPPGEADLFRFDKQHYDVIILGDLSARRLSGGNDRYLETIHDLVDQKGSGLLMMGGFDTFGNSDWGRTPIAKLLPVQLAPLGQLERSIQMKPTPDGIRHYLLRLADKPADNQRLWESLPALKGMTRMGKVKPGAAILAEDAATQAPLLVTHNIGKGRVLAFGCDTTWKWLNYDALRSQAGPKLHGRFWKQLALWLARQEESSGNVWVKPETRRLAAGARQLLYVGLRGANGVDLDKGKFEVKVTNPQGVEVPVNITREDASHRGVFWKTDTPGEYKVVVNGKGKDAGGKAIEGTASVRFIVYQDVAELARQAADHEFMKRLAQAGGGKPFQAEELPRYLEELKDKPLEENRPKLNLVPDWRSDRTSPFFPIVMLAFVGLLSTEWLLRRRWGLV